MSGRPPAPGRPIDLKREIETIERNRAILKPPSSLDAWEAHHRGLWHMYRFNKADNERARAFLRVRGAARPDFARAHAGLSFTHFQNAFQGWAKRETEVERAFETAGQSLMADDRDPAAHWAMGRALWLRGDKDQSIVELQRTIDLSPNFALGHYTLAFVHAQAGDAEAAVGFSDHSRQLSPFDPLLFGMLGARSMALVRLERFDEAAEWGLKAAARPNAHVHIRAIAAYGLALAGRLQQGAPDVSVLLIRQQETGELLRQALRVGDEPLHRPRGAHGRRAVEHRGVEVGGHQRGLRQQQVGQGAREHAGAGGQLEHAFERGSGCASADHCSLDLWPVGGWIGERHAKLEHVEARLAGGD